MVQLDDFKNQELCEKVVQYIRADENTEVMIIDILGRIGYGEAVDPLIEMIEKLRAHEIHLKEAAFEKLGGLTSEKHPDYLLAGLQEDDDRVLMIIVALLDKRLDLKTVNKIKEIVVEDPSQGKKILEAIVFSKSLNLFSRLFEDNGIAQKFQDIIEQSQDMNLFHSFCYQNQVKP